MNNQPKCPACGRDVPEGIEPHRVHTCECSLEFSTHNGVLHFKETLILSDYTVARTKPSLIDPKRRISPSLEQFVCPNCGVRILGPVHNCKCGMRLLAFGLVLFCEMPLNMPRKKPITGYPGPMGAMADMGRFQIMNVQSRENRNSGNLDFSFLCINDQNERVWFMTSEKSVISQDWLRTIGRDLDWSIPLSMQGYEADLRGKIASIEEKMTTISHAKFKNISSIY